MEAYHSHYDSNSSIDERKFKKTKFLINFLTNIILFADFLLFYLSFPSLTIRFGTIPRTCNINFYYCKNI